ncbi:MAG TPA: hypothetical protein VHR86_00050, partial [Armatimonadota bacterium]|nr:hypothetical protein [Armatimonadota bacterium]
MVLFGGCVAVWRYLNTAPAYTMPHPPLPTPNAYDYYAHAGKLIQAIPKADRKKAFDPKAPIPEVTAVVDQCQPAFRLVHQGTAYRYGTPLPRTARAIWHYDLRYLPQFGELSQLLIAESRVAAAHGDYENALLGIKDCIRLGIAVPHGGIEADTMNGLSMENYGLVELVFQARNLNAHDSQKTAQWLGALDKKHIAWSEMLRMQWGFMRESLPIIAQDPR